VSRICALVAVLAIVVAPSRALRFGVEAEAQPPAQSSPEPAQPAQQVQPAQPDQQAQSADASTEPDLQAQRIEEMQREMELLRAQVATLQAQAAQTEVLVSEANQINQQLAGLRDELAAAQAEAAQRAADVDYAIATLIAVQQELMFGDTPDMDWRLADASAILGAPARDHIEWARTALANKDGANARWFLAEAVWAAQRQR